MNAIELDSVNGLIMSMCIFYSAYYELIVLEINQFISLVDATLTYSIAAKNVSRFLTCMVGALTFFPGI